MPALPDSHFITGGRKRKNKKKKKEKKQATSLEREAAAARQKITLLPHVTPACDQLRQLLIVCIPGKKMPCSVKSSQSLLQVITSDLSSKGSY